MNRINFTPRQLRLLLISLASVMVLSGCGDSNTSLGTLTPPPATPGAPANEGDGEGGQSGGAPAAMLGIDVGREAVQAQ